MAERLVIVQGEGPEWLIDLEKNPGIEARIELGTLKIVRELDELPPDPWAEKPSRRAAAKAEAEKAKAEAEAEAAAKEEAEADSGEDKPAEADEA